MKYFLDTEFIEDGKTIDLISLALVREDGKELYLVSSEFDFGKAYENDWILKNVIPHLPSSKEWKTRVEIRNEITLFLASDSKPEFWAWYADYDWVVFCWLWGKMMNLPPKFPRYCRDIKQLADSLGNIKCPIQETGEHNALADARHNKVRFEFLMGHRDRMIRELIETRRVKL